MYKLIWISATLLISCFAIAQATKRYDYCVLGAGPGGLQIAYFMHKMNRNYIVFERNSIAGSSFVKFPRHRYLISANKRFTGSKNIEFNWRHDWNSLISHNESLVMTRYSELYFPHADDLVRYFNDYANELKLNIQYNTRITRLSSIQDPAGGDRKIFKFLDANGNTYHCNVSVVGTGNAAANVPEEAVGMQHTVGYESVSIDPEKFKGRNVLILGTGNSAFEIAKVISPTTNYIHITGRSELRQSWSTHYVGDVRGVNRQHLDGSQLKSLDGVTYADISQFAIVKDKNNKLRLHFKNVTNNQILGPVAENSPFRREYDYIIRCLGFKHDDSIYDASTYPVRGEGKLKKFPKINPNFESVNVPNMYYVGAMAHSLDFRKSSGGFIHGFRYSAIVAHQMMEWKYHGVRWPSKTLSANGVLFHLLKRINQASALYQMFSILTDVILLDDNDKHKYLEDIPVAVIPNLEALTGISPSQRMLVMSFEYGKGFAGPRTDTLGSDRVNAEWNIAHKCNFIHPKIYYYDQPLKELNPDRTLPEPKKIHHVVEDFLTEWDSMADHIIPLKKYLQTVMNQDLTHYYHFSCLKAFFKFKSAPHACMNEQILQKPRYK